MDAVSQCSRAYRLTGTYLQRVLVGIRVLDKLLCRHLAETVDELAGTRVVRKVCSEVRIIGVEGE